MITPETLAQLWHDTYEEVLGDELRESYSSRRYAPRLPSGSRGWDEIPAMPRRRFVEVCRRILEKVDLDDQPYPPNDRRWKR